MEFSEPLRLASTVRLPAASEYRNATRPIAFEARDRFWVCKVVALAMGDADVDDLILGVG